MKVKRVQRQPALGPRNERRDSIGDGLGEHPERDSGTGREVAREADEKDSGECGGAASTRAAADGTGDAVGSGHERGVAGGQGEVVGVAGGCPGQAGKQRVGVVAAVVVAHRRAGEPEVLRGQGTRADVCPQEAEVEELLAARGVNSGVQQPQPKQETEGQDEDGNGGPATAEPPAPGSPAERHYHRGGECEKASEEANGQRDVADPQPDDAQYSECKREAKRGSKAAKFGERAGREDATGEC